MTEFRLKIAATLALIALDAVWIVSRGFTFDMKSLAACLGVTSMLASIGFVYTRLRPDEKLATMSIETAFMMVYSAAGCIFSYLVTTWNLPLIDTQLAAFDEAMGFDWYSYIAFANARPWIGVLSTFVYQSTLAQIALSVVVLTTLGRMERVREMVGTVMVSSFFCVAIAGLLPSAGALAFYHPSAAFYLQNHPVVDMAYKQVFFDLRAHHFTHLSLEDIHGLVAFPSYHVALSVILMIAYRGMPKLFWPVAIWNVLVILSTPIDGGHHLSDGMGGAVLALGCAAFVIWLRKRLPQPSSAPVQEDYGELAGQKA
jgi:membrane-associated phospholipid phosphatase